MNLNPTIVTDAVGNLWMEIECVKDGEPVVARIHVDSVTINVPGRTVREPVPERTRRS